MLGVLDGEALDLVSLGTLLRVALPISRWRPASLKSLASDERDVEVDWLRTICRCIWKCRGTQMSGGGVVPARPPRSLCDEPRPVAFSVLVSWGRPII